MANQMRLTTKWAIWWNTMQPVKLMLKKALNDFKMWSQNNMYVYYDSD